MEESEATTGKGWAASSLDRIGEGPGFRKVRHAIEVTFVFGDGETTTVEAGGVVRVDAATHRQLRNETDEPVTIVVFGAEGGYVGRDGKPGGESGGFLDA